MLIKDFWYVPDVTKDNHILFQKRMNCFSSHVEMAIKCICLGIGAFTSGYNYYDHQDRKLYVSREGDFDESLNLNDFESKIWLTHTCDIINIVDNDNVQEVKPKENGEVDRVVVKNGGVYQL